MSDERIVGKTTSRELLDVLIRAGLIVVLVVSCYQIFNPFLGLMLWSLILAVTLHPLNLRLSSRLGERHGRAAFIIVVIALALLMLPLSMLGSSIVESVQKGMELVESGGLKIPPPVPSVAGWPLVGEPLFNFWQHASGDMSWLLQQVLPHVQGVAKVVLAQLAGAGLGLMIFICALIIAGVIMAYGDTGASTARAIATRISGPVRGPQLAELCTATIRAVAQGVVGIAFIQMLLVGVGLVLMGIPGAGLLALAVLLLGIMQLPIALITLPVIAYVFIVDGVTLVTVLFAVWTFVAGLVDNVLKPLLLGRGVSVPMPVVLIGALGGMVANGIIGLFVGPVILAVGYKLFMSWVHQDPEAETVPEEAPTDKV
ncbi:AI-2E family transporter [Zestomonas carbonaria]|uniref:Transport protein YdiK n=1 Tax=Zestomonas carbonaria TaxID=2762745 RepID=A0A7U7EP97_9GAMM|nr:AI-2E family transporter [Pseudomonas carbonaria]CAD5108571.1 Putative transport protein YdiK [Pseudomonas carbonaria]